MVFNLLHLPSIDSTSSYLLSLIDAPEWTCVTADRQTAGRGRQNRNWFSPPGSGLYLSVLLRPTRPASGYPLISLAAAVSVAETLAELGLVTVDIKWPNDILAGGRKISGILIESSGLFTGSNQNDSPRVIVGIGVNLNQRSFPSELAATATSLAAELDRETSAELFRDRLLPRLHKWYQTWREGMAETIITRWLELSSYGYGREVMVSLDRETLTGHTCGLTPGGALLVRTAAGDIRTIFAGDVTMLRPISTFK